MKNLTILLDPAYTLDWRVLFIFIIFFIIAMFLIKRTIDKSSKTVIIEPDKTLQLQELLLKRTIIVLRTDRKLPIVQYIEDYQEGLNTGMFANTFYLDNYGEDKLLEGKTYDIESTGKGQIRSLRQVSMLICEDFIVH